MNTRTVAGAVVKREDPNSPENLIKQYEAHFAQVLPSHIKPVQWVRLAQGTLRRDPKLAAAAERNISSFLAALLDCARLGHEPGTDQYALTHFNNSKTGVPEIVGIEQYQGEIERMYRAGAVTSVKCEVVRERDEFDWSPTQMRVPYHRYNALAADDERGPLAGAYAYAEMHGGALSQVVVMGKAEIMKHKAVAKTDRFWTGPWEPSMWKKTVVHELEKWVPTSAEYRREQLRAIAEADRVRQTGTRAEPAAVNVDTGEIHDAEIVDEPAPGGGSK